MISGRGGGSARGKIRPPRRGIATGGRDDFEQSWEVLSKALREIHEKNASKLSFEQLYRASYKIVLRKQGDRLYELVKEYEEQWFASHVMPEINKLITTNLVNITLSGVASSTANERRVTGEVFLNGLKASWEDHINVMSMTTDILMYMDRIYCTDNRKASIFTTAMGLFRDHILREPLPAAQNATIFDILNSVILDMIDMERDGDVIDKATVRSCIYMLEGLYETDNEEGSDKLYLTTFEPAFLRASQSFYQKESATLLREADASNWLRQTHKRLLEEAARCQTTIAQSSAKSIARVVEQELISAHLQEFLALEGTGIKAMIQHDRYEDVKLLYQLISRVDPAKEPLKVALQGRVVDMGHEINNTILNTNWFAVATTEEADNADAGPAKKVMKQSAQARATMAAIKWVDEVLKLKDKFDNLWTKCLNSDLQLQTALNKSFATFIDAFQRSSEYVSLFIDDNLKRGIMGKTEAEVDDVLDKATILLRFISDKDMFETYYKKHLARRLLHGKSQSADVEKQMITRMKQEIGNAFTAKLDGMFKDMSMSDELTSGYREYVRNLGDVDRSVPELGVSVLTTNCWPMESMGGAPSREESAPQSTCIWPSHITTLQDSFKAYYLRERNGRKLTWLGYLGNADIKCIFPKVPGKEGGNLGRERKYELNVTTYGMLILMLFNDLRESASLSFEEIQSQTQIPTSELVRNLTTLAVVPKAKVLNKSPATKEVKPGDTFSVNTSFYSKAIKIKAPVIAGAINKVEGEDERKDTEERSDEHRGNIIDTVLVRVMKARKELTHQLLVSETITQLANRFKPDLSMTKKRIESLIEREYLERVEDAAVPTYRYLA